MHEGEMDYDEMEGEHDMEHMMMEGEHGMEEYDEGEHHEGHEDEDEHHDAVMDLEGDDDEEKLDFEHDPHFSHLPPLDKLRKSWWTILWSINDIRAQMNEKRKDNIKILPLSTDHMMQWVAN